MQFITVFTLFLMTSQIMPSSHHVDKDIETCRGTEKKWPAQGNREEVQTGSYWLVPHETIKMELGYQRNEFNELKAKNAPKGPIQAWWIVKKSLFP